MKDKKAYIVVFVLLLIFFLVMFLVFGRKQLAKEQEEATIVLGDNMIWRYNNNIWEKSTPKDSEKKQAEKYHIFLNNEEIGEYNLVYDEGWYAFDEENQQVPLEGDLIAVKGNYDIKISSYEGEEISDKETVQYVLANHGLSISSHFTAAYQIPFDIDQDGEVEMFYVISNAFPTDFYPENIFGFVYMVRGEDILPIYENVEINSSFNSCKPYIQSFIDVNHDNQYEVLFGCGRFSIDTPITQLYELKKNEFEIVFSSE